MRVGSTFKIAFRALRRTRCVGPDRARHHHRCRCGDCDGGNRQWRQAQVEAQIASLGQNVILIFSVAPRRAVFAQVGAALER